MNKPTVSIILLLFVIFSSISSAGTWTQLNMPGVSQTVYLIGIGDHKIVGRYGFQQTESHGLIYDMQTGANYTLDAPGSQSTEIRDIDADNLVGSYYDGSAWHGFIYNMTSKSWTTIDDPNATQMHPYGIDEDTVVGYYFDDTVWHGFAYDIPTQTYTTIDGPETHTYIVGISGDRMIGRCHDGNWHGFIYDTSDDSWTTLDAPAASGTIPTGIDANDIVGFLRFRHKLYLQHHRRHLGIDL